MLDENSTPHASPFDAIRQTRRQELANQLATLPENEDQKRLELRNEIMKWATMFATPSNAKEVHCQKSCLSQRRAFAN
jgi:hypothetical protein